MASLALPAPPPLSAKEAEGIADQIEELTSDPGQRYPGKPDALQRASLVRLLTVAGQDLLDPRIPVGQARHADQSIEAKLDDDRTLEIQFRRRSAAGKPADDLFETYRVSIYLDGTVYKFRSESKNENVTGAKMIVEEPYGVTSG